MPTDFFERQSLARRNTRWLVTMFVLAVIGLVLTTFALTAAAVYWVQDLDPRPAWQSDVDTSFPWHVPVWGGVVALALILGGSLFKISQLASGGTTVAERVGGRRVYPNTTDPVERRLLNVVEEMALASGVPVPPVFLLSGEQGINAFAAGFSPSDAVVGVTRGCAEQLSRDELQGVVAHEFSHILNGDMRLNIRLIGVLHGILLLGLVGREVLYAAGRGGHRSRNSGLVYLAVIGLALLTLGFLGTFFGNLIKAAVSRQREYLADAAAVQFTRNPGGLAGALKQIGAALFGSRLVNPRAAEASHMYFAQGIGIGLAGLMSTHPPLEKRIRRVDPQWDGTFPPRRTPAARTGPPAAASFAGGDDFYGAPIDVAVVEHAGEQVGHPTDNHRQYVRQLVAAMPAEVVEAVHEPYGARGVILATLLDRNPQIRAAQLRVLQETAEPDVYRLTVKLMPSVDALDVRARLPLVDMALPALRALSLAQYQSFSRSFVKLVQADQRLGLFEWVLHQILLRHLRPQFEAARQPQVRYYGLQRLGTQCSVLLSALARASQGGDELSFEAGARHLPGVPMRLLPREECKLSAVQRALQDLSQSAIKHRQRLIDACAATICADAEVHHEEAELLRAVCAVLDCPMPPLVGGQRVLPLEPSPRASARTAAPPHSPRT